MLLLVILLVVVLFGGGGYVGYGRSPYLGGGIGIVGLILVVVLLLWLLPGGPA